jgi:hypothetical protein
MARSNRVFLTVLALSALRAGKRLRSTYSNTEDAAFNLETPDVAMRLAVATDAEGVSAHPCERP